MKIRKATIKDLEEIWKIEKESRALHTKITDNRYKLLTKSETRKQEKSDFIADLQKNLKDKKVIFLVAESSKKIRGWIWSKLGVWIWSDKPPKTIWIEDIGVLKKYHKKGIAQALLNETEKIAMKKGMKYEYLTVWLKNKPAYDFYRKNKFEDFAVDVMVKKLK